MILKLTYLLYLYIFFLFRLIILSFYYIHLDSSKFKKCSSRKKNCQLVWLRIKTNNSFKIFTERKINEKLQRDGVYTFAQSVIKILQLWNSEKSDGNLYSVIANLNGHYSIDEDVFLSVPTKFENGSYIIDDNFFQTNSLISEISKVKKLNLSISFLFINYELKKDAIKRIKDRYKKDIFVKDTEVDKMSIQNVKIDWKRFKFFLILIDSKRYTIRPPLSALCQNFNVNIYGRPCSLIIYFFYKSM